MSLARGTVRMFDLCTGLGANPPRPSMQGSEDTFINLQPSVKLGDQRVPNSNAGIAMGERQVYVNNMPMQAQADPISCGATCMQCSFDTFAGP